MSGQSGGYGNYVGAPSSLPGSSGGYGGGYGGGGGNSFPGWGRPFSYSPNAGPAYQRPQWQGSQPDGANPGGGGMPPPTMPTPPSVTWGNGTGNRPPQYGNPADQTYGRPGLPAPPPTPATGGNGFTRPVQGAMDGFTGEPMAHWGKPVPSFPLYPQSPNGVYSVGPADNQPNPGTPPPPTSQPPQGPPNVNPRPGMDVRPKSMLVSDSFQNTPFQPPMNGYAGGGMPDQSQNPTDRLNSFAPGSGNYSTPYSGPAPAYQQSSGGGFNSYGGGGMPDQSQSPMDRLNSFAQGGGNYGGQLKSTTGSQQQAPSGLFNAIATGQGGGNFSPQQLNYYGPGMGGGYGQFLNWYGQNNAQLNRQGPLYQPGGMFYGR